MKRVIAGIAAVALFVILVALYLRVPLRKGYLGSVSISVNSYHTNANGKVTALVTITNGGAHVLNVGVGTQVLQAGGWVDSMSGLSNSFSLIIDSAALPPNGNKAVSIDVPVSSRPWRVYAMCQKQYAEHWSKGLHFVIDAYVLKNGIVEHFYSEPIER